jgi:hypothetical protein
MGFGALNPEPSPGVYDWSSLDQRMQAIADTGAEPVLTLCCSPDWMKGGEAGNTDWTQIEVAPTPGHFDDFAALAALAAQRYPQVKHFIVWNELKGFYDDAANAWDAAAYTDLYNRVYSAVKKVRPDALVGGPYVVFDSWSTASAIATPSTVSGPWGVLDQRPLDAIEYWLRHNVGADFIAVDAGTATRDAGLTTTDFQATAKLAAATEWLRARTQLPIWWAELYAETEDEEAPGSDPRRAAVMADALVTVARAGSSTALLWQPEESSDLKTAALFSATSSATGGQPLPMVELLTLLEDQLRKDPRRVSTSWDAGAQRWTLTTPEWVVTWTAKAGLLQPQTNSMFLRALS